MEGTPFLDGPRPDPPLFLRTNPNERRNPVDATGPKEDIPDDRINPPEKKGEKTRSKRKTNHSPYPQRKTKVPLQRLRPRTFLCGCSDFPRPSCEDLLPPITEQHVRWKQRRGPWRIRRSRGPDLRVRPSVLCDTTIRTFVCRRGSVHGLVASSRRTSNVDHLV